MKTIILITAAILIGGCASTSGGSKSGSSMLSESQLKTSNPYLLNCAPDQPPTCDDWGGRANKRLVNCRCGR